MRRIFLIFVATLVTPFQLVAQEPGQRVRLTTGAASRDRVVGTLVGEDADSFRVRVSGQAAPMSVARSAVTRLEISGGARRATREGAWKAAGLGVVAGFVIGGVAASHSNDCGIPSNVFYCYTDWYARAFRDGLIGGALGALAGAAIGSTVSTERWEGLSLSRAHQVAIAPRGRGLALSIAF
jgi:hypothetical protein